MRIHFCSRSKCRLHAHDRSKENSPTLLPTLYLIDGRPEASTPHDWQIIASCCRILQGRPLTRPRLVMLLVPCTADHPVDELPETRWKMSRDSRRLQRAIIQHLLKTEVSEEALGSIINEIEPASRLLGPADHSGIGPCLRVPVLTAPLSHMTTSSVRRVVKARPNPLHHGVRWFQSWRLCYD